MAQENTAIVPNQREAYGQISEYLETRKSAIAKIAPKHLDTERVIRLALGASSRSPELLKATPQSWLAATMDAAFYGIEPNPVLGQAYFIPYKNNKTKGGAVEVQFMIGYKGLIQLACEAGFDDIEARIVYENEIEQNRFEETPDDALKPFKHRPLYKDRGDVFGAYAVGWRGVGTRPRFKFLTVDDIKGYRNRSRASESGPWKTDYEAMCMKTAVRRMLSLAVLKPGSKLGNALEQDTVSDQGGVPRARDWVEADPGSSGLKADKVAEQLEKQANGKET